jgi:hypothetical protein
MQHYVGFTRNLAQRLQDHREGTGSATTRRAFEQGIGFVLARTWTGTPKLERQIKERGPVNYCPQCPRRRRRSPVAPHPPIGAGT